MLSTIKKASGFSKLSPVAQTTILRETAQKQRTFLVTSPNCNKFRFFVLNTEVVTVVGWWRDANKTRMAEKPEMSWAVVKREMHLLHEKSHEIFRQRWLFSEFLGFMEFMLVILSEITL